MRVVFEMGRGAFWGVDYRLDQRVEPLTVRDSSRVSSSPYHSPG